MSSGYRLLSYRDTSGQPQAGMLVDDRVHPVAPLLDGIPNSSSVMGLLNAWDRVHPRLHEAALNTRGGQVAWRSRVACTASISRHAVLRRSKLLGPS